MLLTPSVAKTIATSLIGSQLDYCNSVFFNVTEKEISKLQGVQNCLARVVAKSSRFCHITPLLKYLHWLPVRYRIKFKCCPLTYQALTSGQQAWGQSTRYFGTLVLEYRFCSTRRYSVLVLLKSTCTRTCTQVLLKIKVLLTSTYESFTSTSHLKLI